ncbi:hypothetical protein D9M71_603350 [compost metagenome]
MAGDDHGDGIGAIGGADGAHRFRSADAFGQFGVAGGAAEGDVQQGLPDFALELGALWRQWQVEFLPLAGEVFV